MEHQRILAAASAELEEVHQLRERLLQECEAPHQYPAQIKSSRKAALAQVTGRC